MIYITQLLCPQRHCVIAAAWDDSASNANEVEAQLMREFHDMVNAAKCNPYCGLCRSEVLHCESRVTSWSTMAEALPHLRKSEIEQMIVAAAATLKAGLN